MRTLRRAVSGDSRSLVIGGTVHMVSASRLCRNSRRHKQRIGSSSATSRWRWWCCQGGNTDSRVIAILACSSLLSFEVARGSGGEGAAGTQGVRMLLQAVLPPQERRNDDHRRPPPPPAAEEPGSSSFRHAGGIRGTSIAGLRHRLFKGDGNNHLHDTDDSYRCCYAARVQPLLTSPPDV